MTFPTRSIIIICLFLFSLSACAMPGQPTPVSGNTEVPTLSGDEDPTPFEPATPGDTPTASKTAPPTPTFTATYTPTPGPTSTFTPLAPDAVAIHFLALDDNGYSHLFAFAPGLLPLTRLTNGPWDDITPNLSPDGKKLAFASSRNNYFDIYLLNLENGQVSRLTDSPAYDASPTWSPDGQWVLFETVLDENLEIAIVSADDPSQVIRLTDSPSLDQHPIWSPNGRQIIFSSDRSGDFEIWAANLDTPGENRFQNISNAPFSDETHPVWRLDETLLAWDSASLEKPQSIYIWNPSQPAEPATLVGRGGSPTWNQPGDQISAIISGPNQNYLVTYNLSGSVIQPPMPIPAAHGLSWRHIPLEEIPQTFASLARISPTPLYNPETNPETPIPGNRADMAQLKDIKAPHPYLHRRLINSFNALRARAILETGWDVLGNLENAYTPLTSPLDPGRGDSWLYTGRAFGLNPLPLNVGWMYIVREDFEGETYWRLYIRPQAQDGSQGQPVRRHPWDINARYNLNPKSYEQGGEPMKNTPPGYWVDFTRLARQYNWQRPPAQTNWRTFFRGALFNEFTQTGNDSWRSAMLELYPPDVLVTPTVVIPPTRTPTVTPTGYRYKTPTPTPSHTPTLVPTYTPAP